MNTNRFFSFPQTRWGWSSVGLGISFVVLFYLVTNDIIHFSGMLTIGLGVVAGILTMLAMILKDERSWVLWLMLIPGVFAILFALGEILVPH